MTEKKIFRNQIANDSYSLAADLARLNGRLEKSFTDASALKPVPTASVVSTPVSGPSVNSTTAPTPTASVPNRTR